jgi:hypothetical protein
VADRPKLSAPFVLRGRIEFRTNRRRREAGTNPDTLGGKSNIGSDISRSQVRAVFAYRNIQFVEFELANRP